MYNLLASHVIFSCGEADNSSRGKIVLSSFVFSRSFKKGLVQTNVVAYVV